MGVIVCIYKIYIYFASVGNDKDLPEEIVERVASGVDFGDHLVEIGA